jgi:Tfp pilus assembly PilM family ATPase
MKELIAYVYISNTAIQVITSSNPKGGRLQVDGYYEEPVEDGSILNGIIMNSYSLQNTLSQMWKQYNLPTRSVHLVVNGNSITTRHMKIPQMASKDVPAFIRTECKDLENIQNLLVDYSVIVPRNADGSCSIFAVLSPREFVQNYVELFREIKVELSVIDLQQNCLIKLMGHLKSLHDKTFAVLILDQNMLMQCLFSGNDFVMTRRSRILANREDAGFQREIGQNINSMIQFNKSEQTGADLTELFLCGFPDGSDAMMEQFSQGFGVRVMRFPDYQPTELVLPAGVDPSNCVELLGSMIRYSS